MRLIVQMYVRLYNKILIWHTADWADWFLLFCVELYGFGTSGNVFSFFLLFLVLLNPYLPETSNCVIKF